VSPVAAVTCALLTYPPGAAPGLNQALWWPAREQVRQQPGCVLHAVYRELDGAARLFAMSGWSSEHALEQFLSELGPTLDAQQRAAGVHSDRFVGVTIVELTAGGTR